VHDLNTIKRLNFEAFAQSIGKYQAAGKHVLAVYEGMHLTSIETFTDAAEAQVRFDTVNSKRDGQTARLFLPTAAPVPTVGDRRIDGVDFEVRHFPGGFEIGRPQLDAERAFDEQLECMHNRREARGPLFG
jgi:hypothetical protein